MFPHRHCPYAHFAVKPCKGRRENMIEEPTWLTTIGAQKEARDNNEGFSLVYFDGGVEALQVCEVRGRICRSLSQPLGLQLHKNSCSRKSGPISIIIHQKTDLEISFFLNEKSEFKLFTNTSTFQISCRHTSVTLFACDNLRIMTDTHLLCSVCASLVSCVHQ